MKKVLSFVSLLVVALALVGCGGSSDGGSGAAKEVVVTFDEETTPRYTVKFNGLVDGWNYPAESSAASWSPAEGKKLVNLNITVVNSSAESVTVKSNEFSVWAGDWNYLSWFAGDSGLNEFPSETVLAAGEEVTGDLLFQLEDASTDAKTLEFDVYQSNLGRGAATQLTLGEVL